PTVVGGHNVTAYHLSDGQHLPSSASFVITFNPSALQSTSTSLICDTPVFVNQASICTVTVTDTSASSTAPTGTVTFTQTGVTGAFTGSPCTIPGTGASASCSVTFAATTSGTASIVASYGGDSTHSVSDSTSSPASVTIDKSDTRTTVNCIPSGISTSDTSTCTAEVQDLGPVPQTFAGETVSFTQTGIFSGASFTGSPCTLTPIHLPAGPSTCEPQVIFFSASTGTASIVATYGGDAGHSASDNSAAPAVVTVTIHPTATSVICNSLVVLVG